MTLERFIREEEWFVVNPAMAFRAGYFIPGQAVPVRYQSTQPMVAEVCERYGQYDPQGHVIPFGPSFSDSGYKILEFLKASIGCTRLVVICGEVDVVPGYWSAGILRYMGPNTFMMLVASGNLYDHRGYRELANSSPYFDFVSNHYLRYPNATAKLDRWFYGLKARSAHAGAASQ